MITLPLLMLVLALVCFGLATADVKVHPRFQLVPAGLAFGVLSLLLA